MAEPPEEDGGAIPARITREADRWAARLSDTRSKRDREEFETWVTRDPRHRDAFLAAYEALSKGGAASRSRPTPGEPSYVIRPAFAWAAAAMLVLGVGGTLLINPQHIGAVHQTLAAASDASARAVMLADGSRVELAPDSAVRTNFDGHVRAILLEHGGARFIVAHDAAYPFIVTAGNRQVTARGTIFDVTLAPAGMSVRLVEGVIDVTHAAKDPVATKPIRLRRGEMLIATGTQDQVTAIPPIRDTPTTLRSYGATPLASLVTQANIGAAKPIALDGARLGELEVQGRFDTQDTAALARSLAAALDLDLQETRLNFILSPHR